MKNSLLVFPLLAGMLLPTGCTTSRVVFATHSSIGLDVSGTAQLPNKVSFSFNRYEAAIVPRQTNGQAHSVFGGLDADMTWFHGHTIQQTFATGEAAKLATGIGESGNVPSSRNLTNEDSLIFFTGTTYGLHLTAGEKEMAPNLLLGYRRTEAAVIPVPDPSQEVRSVYADILINTSKHTNTPTITTNFSQLGGVRIKQSFATGPAAEALAKTDPDVQQKLNEAAGTTVGKLQRLKERGKGLAEEVARQVDRLKESQLNQAAEALKSYGLITTDNQLADLKSQAAFEKGRILREIAKGLSSENDIAKLEKYLVLLRDIK